MDKNGNVQNGQYLASFKKPSCKFIFEMSVLKLCDGI